MRINGFKIINRHLSLGKRNKTTLKILCCDTIEIILVSFEKENYPNISILFDTELIVLSLVGKF